MSNTKAAAHKLSLCERRRAAHHLSAGGDASVHPALMHAESKGLASGRALARVHDVHGPAGRAGLPEPKSSGTRDLPRDLPDVPGVEPAVLVAQQLRAKLDHDGLHRRQMLFSYGVH